MGMSVHLDSTETGFDLRDVLYEFCTLPALLESSSWACVVERSGGGMRLGAGQLVLLLL